MARYVLQPSGPERPLGLHMQRNLTTSLLVALLAALQSACVVVGYSSRGGWSVWPGGLGLLLMVALAFFLFGSLLRR